MLKSSITKIDRRGFLAATSAALVLAKNQLSSAANVQRSEPPEPIGNSAPEIERRIEGREVAVFTTAANSNHRLSATDTLTFKHLGQPLETQICVFVDPAKTFQTILGIGGALTDASAETFAKLPKAKQTEILNAYFDVRTGIGYTLARTNIHSCDFSSGSYTYVNEGDKDLRSLALTRTSNIEYPLSNKCWPLPEGNSPSLAAPGAHRHS